MARKCKTCGKNLFPDQEAAITAALRASTRFGGTARAYPCPVGDGFHLTTKGEREPSPLIEPDRAIPAPRTERPAVSGFMTSPPLVRARRAVDADLRGEAPAPELAWLYANPLLWLRALLNVDQDVQIAVAKGRKALAHLKPTSGTNPSPEYLTARAAQQQRELGQLHFGRIVERRIDEVKSLLGPQPAVGWVMAGDVVALGLLIAELIDRGEMAGARGVALSAAQRWMAQLNNDERST